MTSGRRSKQRRRASQPRQVGHPAHMWVGEPGESARGWDGSTFENMGTVVGWCASEDELTATRKQTHDALVSLMRDERKGGVSWIFRDGMEAHELLAEMSSDPPTEAHADYFRQLRGKLREYGGWIVVAMAPGVPPDAGVSFMQR